MRVITGFSGAFVGEARVDGERILATIFKEPLARADGLVHDYSSHFCFGVENDADAERKVDVYVDCDSADGLEHDARIYTSPEPGREFSLSDINGKTDRKKRYAFGFLLKAGEKLYVSNTYVRTYERIAPMFDGLGEKSGAERIVYGRSVEGRDLVAHRIGQPPGESDRPEILVLSGWHPPEGDTFATEGMMETLGQERGHLTRAANITVVPIANPDGFVHGYGGCNAALKNPFWEFDPDDEKNMPECHYVWRLMERIRPAVYFDLHGYTFQGDSKKASPYIKPLYFYRGEAVRRFAAALNARIIKRCGGREHSGYLTYAPSTPGARLTAMFNTVTYSKFHFHIGDGVDGIKSMGRDILRFAVEETVKAGDDVFGRGVETGGGLPYAVRCFYETRINGHLKHSLARALGRA